MHSAVPCIQWLVKSGTPSCQKNFFSSNLSREMLSFAGAEITILGVKITFCSACIDVKMVSFLIG